MVAQLRPAPAAADASPIQRQFEQFLRETGRAENTVKAYLSDLTVFLRWCHGQGTSYTGLRRGDALAYLADQGERRRYSTLSRQMCALKVFYGWLEAEGRCSNPFERVNDSEARRFAVKLPPLHPPPLAPAALGALRRTLRAGDDFASLLFAAMTEITLSTLVRPGDLAALRMGDIVLLPERRAGLRWHGGTLRLSRPAMLALARWLRVRRGIKALNVRNDDLLFLTAYGRRLERTDMTRRIREFCATSGVARFTFDALHNSAVRRYRRAGVPKQRLRRRAGCLSELASRRRIWLLPD